MNNYQLISLAFPTLTELLQTGQGHTVKVLIPRVLSPSRNGCQGSGGLPKQQCTMTLRLFRNRTILPFLKIWNHCLLTGWKQKVWDDNNPKHANRNIFPPRFQTWTHLNHESQLQWFFFLTFITLFYWGKGGHALARSTEEKMGRGITAAADKHCLQSSLILPQEDGFGRLPTAYPAPRPTPRGPAGHPVLPSWSRIR